MMFSHFDERSVDLIQIVNKKCIPLKVTFSKKIVRFEYEKKYKNDKTILIPWSYICISEFNEDNDSLNLQIFSFTKISYPIFKKLYVFKIRDELIQEAELFSLMHLSVEINNHLATLRKRSNKPLLIIVNPNSGTKKSQLIMKNYVEPILVEFKINYEVLITNGSKHACNYIQSINDINNYCGIVSVSGDGLLYEIISGIIQRDDNNEVFKNITLGIIPSGSGNGLAASVCYYNKMPMSDSLYLFNTLLLTCPLIEPFDLMKVQCADGSIVPGFLSVTWGLIANVDIGSDKYRWMGNARFSISATVEIAKFKKYSCQLWYLPVSETSSDKNENSSVNFKDNYHYLPDFTESLDESQHNWVSDHGSYVGIIAASLPYLSTDLCCEPKASINDGIIHLILLKSHITRIELMRMLTTEDRHEDKIKRIRCKAFRLLPNQSNIKNIGYMAVDGEKIVSGPIQAEILPSVARLFC